MVTIIVLLILAGVTLSLVAGSDGILEKASNAVDKQNEAQIAEEVELAMAEVQNDYYIARYVEPKTTNATYAEYAKTKLTAGITTSSGAELKLSGTNVSYTKDGKEVATGTFNATTGVVKIAGATTGGSTPAPTYTAYSVGDEVELKSDSTQHFYVIKASGENEENVTLLAKKNIDTTSLAQSASANTVAFSNRNYWSSESGITYPYDLNNTATSAETDAIAIAKAYGKKCKGTGKLMTENDVIKLGGIPGAYNTSACPSWINSSNYWLGSAGNSNTVWYVNGREEKFSYDEYTISNSFGVRPVIEISKSLIQE